MSRELTSMEGGDALKRGGDGGPLDCIHGLHITGLCAWGTCVLCCSGLGLLD